MVYILTHEISSQTDIEALYYQIQDIPGKSIQILTSSYLIESDWSSEQISDYIYEIVGNENKIFITKIEKVYGGKLADGAWNWLDSRKF